MSLHTSPGATPGSGDAGGMNVVVAQAAAALAARGHGVLAITRATPDLPAGDYPLQGNSDGSLGSQAPSPHSPRPSASLVALGDGTSLRKEDLPAAVPSFAAELLELGPFDAVHAHYWLSGLASLPVAGASGVVPAFTAHTVAAQKNARLAAGDRPEPDLRLAAERALLRRGHLIAGSSSELAAVREGIGEPSVGADIIHPGVDTALFRPRDVSRETGPGRLLRIVVLGRVQPLKGQDLAVRAFGALAQRDPELWQRSELIIAGEPTPGAERYADDLRADAQRLGIANRVSFLPAQDREAAAALLASSDVVLVPSRSETFGLVALEAAASGVPCVVGGHTGLMEAAPAGVSAVHVAERDPAAWADAISELLRDPERRKSLGASARAFALQHNWDAHAAGLERVYSGLSLSRQQI